MLHTNPIDLQDSKGNAYKMRMWIYRVTPRGYMLPALMVAYYADSKLPGRLLGRIHKLSRQCDIVSAMTHHLPATEGFVQRRR